MKSRIAANDSDEFDSHQKQLIRYISYELMSVSVIVTLLYTIKQMWYLVAVIGTGGILVAVNLWVLDRIEKRLLCSHGLILITFVTITTANYLVWGIGASYSYWFYIIPLLAAASLVGWIGLTLYSLLGLVMILTFGLLNIPPVYDIPPQQLMIIEKINHAFAYLITVTIVAHLMLENIRYETVLLDKTQLLADEKEKFEHLAHFDQLTQLPNRQYFKQQLQESIETLKPHSCITVYFMDLDNLKYVNDYYGHEVGDALLIESARRLKKSFQKGDFVARLGGDEFTAIVLHPSADNTPLRVVQTVIQAFESPFYLEKITYHCSISIGFSNYPKDAQSIKGLMVAADLAMYAAKKIPGNSFTKAKPSPL